MTSSAVTIEGIGFWGSGLPSWDAARAFLDAGQVPTDSPRRPAPDLLPPNERRRAPDTVAVAIEAASAACRAAGADPGRLPSIFASTHGDLPITDYMCSTLVSAPATLSPTKFHNSVHNAAAGYWTIGVGCMAPATAISAWRATIGLGLLEALAQLRDGEPRVLLVAFDVQSAGPLGTMSHSEGLLAAAFVLAAHGPRPVAMEFREGGAPPSPQGALSARYAANAMQPVLPLLEAIAGHGPRELDFALGPAAHLHVHLR